MEATAHCKYCGRDLPETAFNFANKAAEKRHRRCRDCFRDYNRQRYLLKGGHIRSVVAAYQAANAETIRARRRATWHRDRATHAARASRYYQDNRDRLRAYRAAWLKADRAANPEKYREKGRRLYRQNPTPYKETQFRRRAQKLASAVLAVSAIDLAAKWTYWAGRCWMCGAEAVEWDHVKPLAKGGAHILANLRPACLSCNRSKRDRWPLPV